MSVPSNGHIPASRGVPRDGTATAGAVLASGAVRPWDPLPAMKSNRQPRAPSLVVLFCLVFLAGCNTTNVQVTGSFPQEAIVEPIPVSLGIHFDESFRSFVLAEPVPERGDWNIAIGDAQVAMFRAILPAMFESVREIDDPASATGVDAVLSPAVDDMQFAIPFQTKGNFFEVWIRYQLTLTQPGGEVIASWPITAYGRTRDALLSSDEAALDQAATMALRDAAAFLAIDFRNTEELERWFAAVLAPDAAGGGASTLDAPELVGGALIDLETPP